MKLIGLLFFLLPYIMMAQGQGVSGKVLDSVSNKPLPYASILLAGTNMGTVSNIDGEFVLKLENGKYLLFISYVGYKTDSISISVPTKKNILISLIRQPIILPEVIVSGEDPAYRIIREAIKRKRINRRGLENYEYNAYRKGVMRSAGKITMVQEMIVRGFKLKNNIEKEFILKTHKTENQKKSYNLDLTSDLTNKHLPDFSADTLDLLLNKVYLPIADNAFDYYDYKLLNSIKTMGAPIYEIRVTPRSKIQPLVEGLIYIEGKTYSIVKVDLKASEGVRFPYVHNLKLNFKQSLERYDGYWLPNYCEMNISLGFSMGGLIGVEPVSFQEVNIVTEYKINQPVPDSVKAAVMSNYGGFVSDTSQMKIPPKEISSGKMKTLRPVPLTKSEVNAFATIDTTMTIEKSIKVTGALAAFVPKNPGSNRNSDGNALGKLSKLIFNYVYLNNNRVEYLTLGAKYNSNIFGETFYTNSFAAYSTGMKKAIGSLGFGYSLSNSFLSGVELEVYKKVQEWQPLNPYSSIMNATSVLLGFDDQYNYYLSSGYRIGVTKNTRYLSASINFISDKESSLKEDRYLSIINPKRFVIPNPKINEGTDRKIRLSLQLGKSPFELQLMPVNGLLTELELSRRFLSSDFDYYKIILAGQLRMKTFYDELFLSPYIQINLEAGYLSGRYGIQQILSPISAMGFYSPVTSFKGLKPYQFAGDKMIAIHIEHNWRTIIFQALGLNFLTNLDLDIITGAAALRIFNDSNYLPQLTQKEAYWEIYSGISRILGVINLEISYNSFNKYTVTLSAAPIF